MNVRLLPEKHVRASESLLGLGALVLTLLESGAKSLDSIWSELKEQEPVRRCVHGSITLDTVILAIDFLYTIDAVVLNREGSIENASR